MGVQSESRNDRTLAGLFGIDPRGLAFFRITLASCALFDLAQRSVDLYAHYTDAGVLSRVDDLRMFAGLHEWPFCLHMISGALEIQAVLFLIHAAAAVALLVGYHTRAAAFLVWLLLVSVQLRNPLIGGSGDTLLRMYALWGIFLPLGCWLSLDNVRRQRVPASMVLSVGSLALLTQVVIVYWAEGYAKLPENVWLDGGALLSIFNDHLFSTSFGRALAQFPALCALLSLATVVLELAGPPLLVISGLYPPLRIAVIAVLCALNLTFALTLDVGLFPWLMAVGTLTFLPPEIWDRVAAWGALRRLRARASARPAWRGLIQRVRRTGAPASLLPEIVHGRLMNGVCALLLVVVVVWNVGVARDRGYNAPWYTQWIVGPLLLQQDWRIFAKPPARTGWIIIQARLASGREIDLMAAGGRASSLEDHGGVAAIDWETPRGLDAYANVRWRALLRNVLTTSDERAAALLYGRYLCREWNRRHAGDDQLRAFHIVYVSAELQEPYDEMSYQNEVVWQHDCFG